MSAPDWMTPEDITSSQVATALSSPSLARHLVVLVCPGRTSSKPEDSITAVAGVPVPYAQCPAWTLKAG